MMDATEQDHNEPVISPFDQICPRHGEKVNRHHNCPKCVIEEVRRHESRIHMPLELEHDAPIPADGVGNGNQLSIEIG